MAQISILRERFLKIASTIAQREFDLTGCTGSAVTVKENLRTGLTGCRPCLAMPSFYKRRDTVSIWPVFGRKIFRGNFYGILEMF